MMSKRIPGANMVLGPPKGWDVKKHGPCATLAIRRLGNVFLSAWEPTPEELAALNAGGYVVLAVAGGQPAVSLGVETIDRDTDEQ